MYREIFQGSIREHHDSNAREQGRNNWVPLVRRERSTSQREASVFLRAENEHACIGMLVTLMRPNLFHKQRDRWASSSFPH